MRKEKQTKKERKKKGNKITNYYRLFSSRKIPSLVLDLITLLFQWKQKCISIEDVGLGKKRQENGERSGSGEREIGVEFYYYNLISTNYIFIMLR